MFFTSFFKNKLFVSVISLLFSINALSNPCEERFLEHPFVHFTKEQLGEYWQNQMPRNWESRIMKYTTFWKREDMDSFLNYLINRIGEEETLNRVKSSSYFNSLRYKDFLDRILLYEKYIGVEEVTNRLRKSLSGFNEGDVKKIEKVVQYLEEDMGLQRAAIKEAMKSNLQGFTIAKVSELEKVVKYLEEDMGLQRAAIKEAMKSSFYGFALAKASELKKVVQFLEKYLSRKTIIEKIKKNLYSFSLITISDLEAKEQRWGFEKLKENLETYSFKKSHIHKIKKLQMN